MTYVLDISNQQGGEVASNQQGRTSSKNHGKKLHFILRYVKSSRGFTVIKQVSACSIQICWGSVGFNAWNTFVLMVEHPYIVKKLKNPWIQVSSPSMPRKLRVTDCSSKPNYMFSFRAANYSHKLHKNHSIKTAEHGIRRFHQALHHQISECTRACLTTPGQGISEVYSWLNLSINLGLQRCTVYCNVMKQSRHDMTYTIDHFKQCVFA